MFWPLCLDTHQCSPNPSSTLYGMQDDRMPYFILLECGPLGPEPSFSTELHHTSCQPRTHYPLASPRTLTFAFCPFSFAQPFLLCHVKGAVPWPDSHPLSLGI